MTHNIHVIDIKDIIAAIPLTTLICRYSNYDLTSLSTLDRVQYIEQIFRIISYALLLPSKETNYDSLKTTTQYHILTEAINRTYINSNVIRQGETIVDLSLFIINNNLHLITSISVNE